MKQLLFLIYFGLGHLMLLGQTYETLFNEANKMRMYGNDSAFILIDKAIQMVQGTEKEMYTRVVKGDFFNRFDSIDGGIAYITDLFERFDQQLSFRDKVKSYCIQAGLYRRKNDFQQEIEMALEALEIAENIQDTQSLYTANFHLMMGYDNADRPEVSNRFGLKAFELALASGNKFSLYETAFFLFSNNKGRMGEEPFASYLYEFLKVASPEELPKDATHSGFEYLEQFKLSLEDWRGLYNKALAEGKVFSTIRVGNKIGRILVDTGEYFGAVEILKPTRELAQENNSMLDLRYTLSLLRKAYEGLGNDRLALTTLKDYYRVRDSLQGIEILKNADALNVKFETARKDRELALQHIELLESQRQRNVLFISLAGLLILGSLSFYMLKKRQQYQNQLAHQENLLKAQEIDQLKQKQKIVALDYMLMGEEKERSRIAKDLHDSLGSILTSAKNQMLQVQNQLDELESQSGFGTANDLIKQASVEVRRISHDMMPSALTSLGVQAAVEDLARQSESPGKFTVKTHFFDLDETTWSDHHKVGVYRIVQELTNNVVKHAGASNLIIQLSQDEGMLSLIIEDNGKGFEPDGLEDPKGIGLKNIKSRVEYLDGTLDLNTKPGGPTTFTIEIPI